MNEIRFTGFDKTPFGTKVKSKVTGFEGHVVGKFYVASGCSQYWVQSEKIDPVKNRPFSAMVASSEAEILDAPNKFGDTEFPPEESYFNLGDVVSVPTCQAAGTVSSIAFYPFNPPHVEIQPPYIASKGILPGLLSVAETLVELVSPAIPVSTPVPEEKKRPSPTTVPISQRMERPE